MNTQHDYHDIPALLCEGCGKMSTKGGPAWERENPTTELCKCPKDTTDQESSKKFAKSLQGTGIEKGMDEANRTALQVMANEGSAAAIKHMFTDQNTGRTLSYAEMRMLYG